MESASRGELIAMLTKQKVLGRRYQRKLTDLVTAYKEVGISNKKLEVALEKQQDEAVRRARELSERHKKDMANNDKLVQAMKRKTATLEGDLKALQTRLDGSTAEHDQLRAQVSAQAASSKTADRLRDRAAVLEEKLAEAERAAELERDRYAALSGTNKNLAQKAEELELVVKQKDIDLDAQTKLNDALRDSRRGRASVEPSHQHRASLGQVASLKAQQEKAESELEAKSNEIVALEGTVASLERSARARAQAEEKTARSAAAAARQLEALKVEAAEAAATREQLAADVKRLTTELEESEQAKHRAEDAADEQVAAAAAAKSRLEARVAILEAREAQHDQADQVTGDQLSAQRAEHKVMHDQIAELQDRLDASTAEAAAQVKALKLELRDRTSEAGVAGRELTRLQQERSELETARSRLQRELTEVTTELEATREEAAAAARGQETAERAVTATTAAVKLEQQQRVALEQLVATLRQTVQENEAQGVALRATSRDAEDKMVKRSEDLISAKAQAAALQVKLDAANVALSTTRESHAASSSKLAALQAAAVKRAEAAEKRAVDAEREAEQAKAHAATAKAALQAAAEKGATEADCMAVTLAAVEAKLEATTSTLAKAEAEAARQTELASAASGKTESIAAELSRATVRAQTAQIEVDRLLDEVNQATVKLRREEANAASLKYTCDAQAETLQTIRKAKREADAREVEAGDSLAELRNELAKKSAALAELQVRLKAADERVEGGEVELAEAHTQIAELRKVAEENRQGGLAEARRVADLETQAAVATEAMNGLSAANAEATEEVEILQAKLSEAGAVAAAAKEKLTAVEAEASKHRAARDEAEKALATKAEEHQLYAKKQIQQIAQLKKMVKDRVSEENSAKQSSTPAKPTETAKLEAPMPVGKVGFALSYQPFRCFTHCHRIIGVRVVCDIRECLR